MNSMSNIKKAPLRSRSRREAKVHDGRHAPGCLWSGRLSGASERSAAPERGPSYRPRSARQEKLFRLLLHSMFILRGGRQRCRTSDGWGSFYPYSTVRRPPPLPCGHRFRAPLNVHQKPCAHPNCAGTIDFTARAARGHRPVELGHQSATIGGQTHSTRSDKVRQLLVPTD